MKVCSTCKTPKHPDSNNFHKDRSSKDGFYHKCKPCTKTRADAYREGHREYFRAKALERYDPSTNPERYLRYQTANLARREKELRTVRGRMYALVKAARARAEKRNHPFELSIEWAMEQFDLQNGKCCLTGIPLTLDFTSGSRKYHPYNPSLDRKDSNLGYTRENTRLVCVAVNIALNEFGEEVLRNVCEGFLSNRCKEGECLRKMKKTTSPSRSIGMP